MVFDPHRAGAVLALLLPPLLVVAGQDPQIEALQREKATLERELADITASNAEKRKRLEALNLRIQELLKQQKSLDSQIIGEKQGP